MRKSKPRSSLDVAAERLREIVLSVEEGMLLGSEDSLVTALGVSRATVRQVARLLEREGLLRVRRGINGGYFGARPDLNTIETTVSAYLETLDMDAEDVTVIASLLWVEVLRKAAGLRDEAAKALAERFKKKVKALRADAPFSEISRIERESQYAIFGLIKSRYIELIFQINATFSQRRFPVPSERDATPDHHEFVRAWRDAKLMELNAIAEGDQELGMMAARHIRDIWHRRIWSHAYQ